MREIRILTKVGDPETEESHSEIAKETERDRKIGPSIRYGVRIGVTD